jgi:hypothetical protein
MNEVSIVASERQFAIRARRTLPKELKTMPTAHSMTHAAKFGGKDGQGDAEHHDDTS